MTRRAKREAGFTILELMIASTVFAVILLVVAVGVINVTNDYYKGITSTSTQSIARQIASQLSASIEFGQTVTPGLSGGGGVQGICIDNTLYAYQLGQEVSDSPSGPDVGYHGLLVSSDCSAAHLSTLAGILGSPGSAALAPGTRELLTRHMRLSELNVVSVGSNLWTITVRILYGDNALMRQPPPLPTLGNNAWMNVGCAGGIGDQFCAVSDLSTTVDQRL